MKKLKHFAPILFTAALVCLPLVTFAQRTIYSNDAPNTVNPSNPNTGYPPAPNAVYPSGNQNPSSGGSSSYSIQNPLAVSNFCDLIKLILQALMVIGLPVAVVFLVYVGFKFVAAQGNSDKIREAQSNLLNTVIGIAIFLGAWTIATVIANTMQQLGVAGFSSCIR